MIPVRYLMVARQLSDAINGGEYPVGSLLPTEHELSEIFHVSRSTIRAAISRLQEQGLVSRKKRVGTRVESQTSQKGYSQSLGTIADLVHMAKTQKREVKEIESFVAEASQAVLLGIQPGEKYIRISSIRTDSAHPGRPVCWTDVYVPNRFERAIALVKERDNELIAALIEEEYGSVISMIEQRVEAVSMTKALGLVLDAPSGEPALKITRTYRDRDGAVMMLSVTVHPRERFELTMQMVREKN